MSDEYIENVHGLLIHIGDILDIEEIDIIGNILD